MQNPFGAILASTHGLKKASPPGGSGRAGTATGQQGGGRTKASAAAATPLPARAGSKQASTNAVPKTGGGVKVKPAANKLAEIKSVLSRLETLTGGRLTSKELFGQFVAASRVSAAASASNPTNFCIGQQENTKPLAENVQPAAAPSSTNPDVDADVNVDGEDDSFDFSALGLGFSPEPIAAKVAASKSLHRPSRYSLGVSRFSLPGRLSIDTRRRMSMSELGKHGISPPPRTQAEGSVPPAFAPEVDSDHGNFLEFCVVGVDRAILSGFEAPRRASLQPAQLLDIFPVRDSQANQGPLIESIADYCFPSGVSLQLVSGQAAIDLLIQAPPRDSFHVLQFMDASGRPTYAACLTVCELQEAPNEIVVDNLLELQVLEKAAATLKRFLRRVANGGFSRRVAAAAQHDQTPLKGGGMSAAGTALVNRMVAWSTRKTPAASAAPTTVAPTPMSSLLQRFGALQDKTEPTAATSATASTHQQFQKLGTMLPTPERLMYNPRGLAEFFSDENSYSSSDNDIDDDEDDGDDAGTARTKASGADIIEEITGQALRRRRASSSSSSFSSASAVPAVSRERHMVLSQRAYCILATKPLHTLFFKVLEAVAHKERSATFRGATDGHKMPLSVPSASILRASALLSLQVREYSRQRSASTASNSSTARGRSESAVSTTSNSSTSSLALQSASGAGGIVADAIFFARKTRRDRFLAQMQALPLAPDAEDGVISVTCPSYIKSLRIESRTTTLEEWTTATLLCTLPASVVVQVLSLLLLEKSLVVCGSDLGLVSAVGTAFTLLLKPFSWQGVFVPILPLNALEVLEAPVPFIVGVTTKLPSLQQISSSAAVLYLDDFLTEQQQQQTGGRRGMLQRRRLLLVPTDDAGAALTDPAKSADLASLVKEVEALAFQLRLGKRAPSLRTASIQLVSFMLGLTPAEKRLVHALYAVVEAHNKSLLGPGLLDTTGGWRKYGLFNESSNSWEFYPELFIEPLRARLAFQEGVVHTQLFVSLLDQMKSSEEASV